MYSAFSIEPSDPPSKGRRDEPEGALCDGCDEGAVLALAAGPDRGADPVREPQLGPHQLCRQPQDLQPAQRVSLEFSDKLHG